MVNILVQQALVLRKLGLSERDLEAALRSFNLEQCDPPKSDEEVHRVAQLVSHIGAEGPDSIGVPEIVQLSSVQPTEVQWLAEPYVPLGKVTLLEGDPSVGKTYLALDMMASVTRGRGLLGQDERVEPAGPANCLFMTAEDGLADTIRPRLDAAGADADRVFVLCGIKTAEGKKEFTLQHIEILRQAVLENQPALIVIDPIQGFLGAGVDMHRANEIRPLLAGLARVGEDFGLAIVAIRHLRKSSADRAIYRGLGSIDFAAAVRSILVVCEHPDNKNQRMLVHLKSNLAEPGASRVFEMDDGKVKWVGESSLTANDLDRRAQKRPSAGDEAEQFLLDLLSANGEMPALEIFEEAKQEGISVSAVKRAKLKLKIKSHRATFGPGSKVFWKLPETS